MLPLAMSLIHASNCSNELSLFPDQLPRSRLVGPKLAIMERRIAELDLVVTKLVSWIPTFTSCSLNELLQAQTISENGNSGR